MYKDSKSGQSIVLAMPEKSEPLLDPAEYLFKHTKYHDCYLSVGVTKEVEKIGVVSSHLLAHSSVFRQLLTDDNLKDPEKTRIDNVSPEVFKLMLTHVYGGKLPEMTRSTAAQLALCAQMYNIEPLVSRACQYLIPESVEDVFPALWCVAYVSCPELEPYVTKIIQEETKEVFSSREFLDLDAKCLDFIAQQDKLAISELDLWNGLLKWAQVKALADPDKSLRQHLQSTLQYVRLTTLSQEEIIKEVMPSKILSASEVMDLLTAVTSNKQWEFPGLCTVNKVRELSDDVTRQGGQSSPDSKDSTAFQFDCEFSPLEGYTKFIELQEYKVISNLTIKTKKNIEINSFIFKSRSISELGNQPIYKLSCSIMVSKTEDGFCTDTRIIQVGGSVVGGEEIAFPLKLRNGQLLQLEADSSYNVALEFSTPHPTATLSSNTYSEKTHLDNMHLTYNTPIHVRKIKYKV